MEEGIELIGRDISELEELMRDFGQPKFRAKQIFGWLIAERLIKLKR